MSQRSIAGRSSLCLWLTLSTLGVAQSPATSPTDQILRLVPGDMAFCLIVEDVAGHYQQLLSSPLRRRVAEQPAVQEWQARPEFKKLLAIRSVLPFHFGIALDQLRDDILGQSVVLAFRPADGAGQREAGIVFCCAKNQETLASLIEFLSGPPKDRDKVQREHRGVRYLQRPRGRGGVDYLLQIGAVGVITDKEPAIRAVIDTSLDGKGLAADPTIQQMRHALPKGCLMQALFRPRSFDDALARSAPTGSHSDAFVAQFMLRHWQALRWMAFTVRCEQALHVGWHLDFDEDHLPPESRTWMERTSGNSNFWDNVASNAFAVIAGRCDFLSLTAFIAQLIAAENDKDARMVAEIFTQLLAGFDIQKDLLPRLGPEVGLVVRPQPDKLIPILTAAVQLQDCQPDEKGSLSLSQALETALRPFLVLIAFDHNHKRRDTWMANTQIANGRRVHYLAGGQRLPAWLQPGFAIADGYLVAGSSPQAVLDWRVLPEEQRLTSLPFYRQLRRWFPDSYVLGAYANLSAIRKTIAQHRTEAVDLLAKGHSERHQQIGKKLDLLLGLTGLVEHIVLGTYRDQQARHWTLSIIPALGPSPSK